MGDIVYNQVHEPKNKLAPRFEGPYRVLECGPGNKVTIKDLHTFTTKVAHLDHLKWMGRPSTLVDDPETSPLPPPVPSGAETQQAQASEEYRKKLRSHSRQ